MQAVSKQRFDVIVVGSGASGGWAAKRLAEAGVKVALLDCGRPQSDQNFNEHQPGFELKYRDRLPETVRRTRPVQKDCYACTEFNYKWFANDIEEPYTTAPGTKFSWQGRVRMVGGRTNVWGRVSLRVSDLDLKAASFDGFGADWPISYKDLAPYYDQVEEYVGVAGTAEGYPYLPDGKFQPAMPFNCLEMHFRDRVKAKLGWLVTPTRTANITKPLNGRAPCHYCGPCHRGCVTHSYFNSSFTTVADAVASGHCTLIPNAMAYQVLMDTDRNRACGVLYIDRNTREAVEIEANTVVLAAQALESTRILLNSANRQHPNGLGNSSGALGHYLMDHVMGGGATGEFPDWAVKPTLNGPRRPAGMYVARFRNVPGSRSKKFLRGYGFQGAGHSSFNFEAPGFGAAYKKSVLDPVTTVRLGGFGESLGRWENYVDIDPSVRDTFGIPVLRTHMSYGQNESAMVQDMSDAAAEMLEAAGATNIKPVMKVSTPGWAIHEVGVARMGNDPKKTVLNAYLQSHDVKNLFVMDGAGFPSTGCQNPTLTIMALTVRSCDYLMQEMKKSNL
jgi:choline dehydrogenase-like flavoprotein